MILHARWLRRGAIGVVGTAVLIVLATPILLGNPEPTPDPENEPARDLQQAVADLAQRLGVDPSILVVLSVEDVTWPDSSLGCPQPDRAYLQVLTPGRRIHLGLDGKVYAYHSGRSGMPTYCENPQPPVADDSPGLRPAPIAPSELR